MLPPPPASRQASYAYSLPRKPSSLFQSNRHGADSEDAEEGEGEGDGDWEGRMEMEEEIEGRRGLGEEGRERGLEETLESIGFGAYHWRLLALCGFGWMSDNSALQCIAVILPRVQVHFDLSSKVVGLLSASTMAGMMIGAIGWGTVSDLLGRALPFNATLFLTAVFGIGASFAPSFPILCLWMFFLGSAVGGSMPTDGTLFLENLPHSKQYLLTLLSVFFSLGAVLSSVVSLIFLPAASCHEFAGCDIEGKANDGWRRVLFVLGFFNLVCAFARWFLFRLHESPRYLVTTGREHEAVVVLRAIATFNDPTHGLDIQCADVQHTELGHEDDGDAEANMNQEEVRDKKNSGMPSPVPPESGEASPLPTSQLEGGGGGTRYDAVGMGHPGPARLPIRMGSAFYRDYTPSVGDLQEEPGNEFDESFAQAEALLPSSTTSSGQGGGESASREEGKRRRPEMGGMRKSSRMERIKGDGVAWLDSWRQQMGKLFVPQWRRTVILMWIIWGSMSFSYTMFNVWLPAVLENRATGDGAEAIRQALREFVLYSLAGCPGSIVGAWMIQTRLGRRKSLAIVTLATGLSTFAFIKVESDWAVIVSSMTISAAATAMYAVLYGMTPETFGTSIRGTACGTSAALSRLTGIVAPVSAGFLLTISPDLPVFASAAIFCLTAGCSLMLPFERIGGTKGRSTIAH